MSFISIPRTLIFCLITAASASTFSVEMRGNPAETDEQDTRSIPVSADERNDDNDNKRQLRGDFISLSKDRTLKTSVGTFRLATTTSLEDHRKSSQASANVELFFYRDRLRKVVIY